MTWTHDSQGVYRRGEEAIMRFKPVNGKAGWWRGLYWSFWTAKGPFETLKQAKNKRIKYH